jgi:hypothetical protein
MNKPTLLNLLYLFSGGSNLAEWVDIKTDKNPLPCISCCLDQGPKNTKKIRSQLKHFLQYMQPKNLIFAL